MKKVAIIGAGISGLFIANLFKRNKKYQVNIFERNSLINSKEGYGIQLSVRFSAPHHLQCAFYIPPCGVTWEEVTCMFHVWCNFLLKKADVPVFVVSVLPTHTSTHQY